MPTDTDKLKESFFPFISMQISSALRDLQLSDKPLFSEPKAMAILPKYLTSK